MSVSYFHEHEALHKTFGLFVWNGLYRHRHFGDTVFVSHTDNFASNHLLQLAIGKRLLVSSLYYCLIYYIGYNRL